MAGLVRDLGAEPPDAEEFSKIWKRFLNKIAKMALFWPIFQIKFNRPALHFRAFGRKSQLGREL